MRKWGLLLLIAMLAACGSDDKDKNKNEAVSTESSTNALDANTGLDLNFASAALPGCEDINSDECPAPLQLPMDGTISDSGITVQYPARYFDTTVSSEGKPIQISPSENNRYEDTAVFQLYFSDSVEQALSELTDPETKEWTASNISDVPGTIGVSTDESQEPPVSTVIGAFPLPDNRVLVFRAQTTGEYSWPLYSELYRAMLNSIVLDGGEAATATETPAQ
jgi:hypothetical protein